MTFVQVGKSRLVLMVDRHFGVRLEGNRLARGLSAALLVCELGIPNSAIEELLLGMVGLQLFGDRCLQFVRFCITLIHR